MQRLARLQRHQPGEGVAGSLGLATPLLQIGGDLEQLDEARARRLGVHGRLAGEAPLERGEQQVRVVAGRHQRDVGEQAVGELRGGVLQPRREPAA